MTDNPSTHIQDDAGHGPAGHGTAAFRRLQQELETYRGIFEISGAGTIVIEADMTVSLVNTGFERLTGYTKTEIEGKMKWSAFVATESDLEMMKTYHSVRRDDAGQAPTEYEFTLVSKNGGRKNIFLTVDLIPGSDRSVASLIDVTSLITAERSLRESQAKLGGILEAFEGDIYICTRDRAVAYMNRSLKQRVGRADPGLPCHRLIYRLPETCGWCPADRVFRGETVKSEFRSPVDGRWYYAVNSPIFDANGRVVKTQTVVIDIHRRKQAEAAIRAREQYLHEENIRLRSSIHDRYRFRDIVGKSPAMQKIYELILRSAATGANVIIYGESGTGKELVARAIHDLSDRSAHGFVPVNCGAIPGNLLESEFFGYKKGAFTGAHRDKPGYLDQAANGTLFLDEVGEIDMTIQVKLLRALEGGGYTPVGGSAVEEPDVRIIAATNRNLNERVEKGLMREDFFYRIHIIPIYMPPLRERREDIPLLVEHFLKKHRGNGKMPNLPGRILTSLADYDWPGNIRELENTIQRFVNLNHIDFSGAPARAALINRDMLPADMGGGVMPLREAMQRFEKTYIARVLEQHRWHRSKVAGLLGIERKTLYLKIKNLGLQASLLKSSQK